MDCRIFMLSFFLLVDIGSCTPIVFNSQRDSLRYESNDEVVQRMKRQSIDTIRPSIIQMQGNSGALGDDDQTMQMRNGDIVGKSDTNDVTDLPNFDETAAITASRPTDNVYNPITILSTVTYSTSSQTPLFGITYSIISGIVTNGQNSYSNLTMPPDTTPVESNDATDEPYNRANGLVPSSVAHAVVTLEPPMSHIWEVPKHQYTRPSFIRANATHKATTTVPAITPRLSSKTNSRILSHPTRNATSNTKFRLLPWEKNFKLTLFSSAEIYKDFLLTNNRSAKNGKKSYLSLEFTLTHIADELPEAVTKKQPELPLIFEDDEPTGASQSHTIPTTTALITVKPQLKSDGSTTLTLLSLTDHVLPSSTMTSIVPSYVPNTIVQNYDIDNLTTTMYAGVEFQDSEVYLNGAKNNYKMYTYDINYTVISADDYTTPISILLSTLKKTEEYVASISVPDDHEAFTTLIDESESDFSSSRDLHTYSTDIVESSFPSEETNLMYKYEKGSIIQQVPTQASDIGEGTKSDEGKRGSEENYYLEAPDLKNLKQQYSTESTYYKPALVSTQDYSFTMTVEDDKETESLPLINYTSHSPTTMTEMNYDFPQTSSTENIMVTETFYLTSTTFFKYKGIIQEQDTVESASFTMQNQDNDIADIAKYEETTLPIEIIDVEQTIPLKIINDFKKMSAYTNLAFIPINQSSEQSVLTKKLPPVYSPDYIDKVLYPVNKNQDGKDITSAPDISDHKKIKNLTFTLQQYQEPISSLKNLPIMHPTQTDFNIVLGQTSTESLTDVDFAILLQTESSSDAPVALDYGDYQIFNRTTSELSYEITNIDVTINLDKELSELTTHTPECSTQVNKSLHDEADNIYSSNAFPQATFYSDFMITAIYPTASSLTLCQNTEALEIILGKSEIPHNTSIYYPEFTKTTISATKYMDKQLNVIEHEMELSSTPEYEKKIKTTLPYSFHTSIDDEPLISPKTTDVPIVIKYSQLATKKQYKMQTPTVLTLLDNLISATTIIKEEIVVPYSFSTIHNDQYFDMASDHITTQFPPVIYDETILPHLNAILFKLDEKLEATSKQLYIPELPITETHREVTTPRLTTEGQLLKVTLTLPGNYSDDDNIDTQEEQIKQHKVLDTTYFRHDMNEPTVDDYIDYSTPTSISSTAKDEIFSTHMPPFTSDFTYTDFPYEIFASTKLLISNKIPSQIRVSSLNHAAASLNVDENKKEFLPAVMATILPTTADDLYQSSTDHVLSEENMQIDLSNNILATKATTEDMNEAKADAFDGPRIYSTQTTTYIKTVYDNKSAINAPHSVYNHVNEKDLTLDTKTNTLLPNSSIPTSNDIQILFTDTQNFSSEAMVLLESSTSSSSQVDKKTAEESMSSYFDEKKSSEIKQENEESFITTTHKILTTLLNQTTTSYYVGPRQQAEKMRDLLYISTESMPDSSSIKKIAIDTNDSTTSEMTTKITNEYTTVDPIDFIYTPKQKFIPMEKIQIKQISKQFASIEPNQHSYILTTPVSNLEQEEIITFPYNEVPLEEFYDTFTISPYTTYNNSELGVTAPKKSEIKLFTEITPDNGVLHTTSDKLFFSTTSVIETMTPTTEINFIGVDSFVKFPTSLTYDEISSFHIENVTKPFSYYNPAVNVLIKPNVIRFDDYEYVDIVSNSSVSTLSGSTVPYPSDHIIKPPVVNHNLDNETEITIFDLIFASVKVPVIVTPTGKLYLNSSQEEPSAMVLDDLRSAASIITLESHIKLEKNVTETENSITIDSNTKPTRKQTSTNLPTEPNDTEENIEMNTIGDYQNFFAKDNFTEFPDDLFVGSAINRYSKQDSFKDILEQTGDNLVHYTPETGLSTESKSFVKDFLITASYDSLESLAYSSDKQINKTDVKSYVTPMYSTTDNYTFIIVDNSKNNLFKTGYNESHSDNIVTQVIQPKLDIFENNILLLEQSSSTTASITSFTFDNNTQEQQSTTPETNAIIGQFTHALTITPETDLNEILSYTKTIPENKTQLSKQSFETKGKFMDETNDIKQGITESPKAISKMHIDTFLKFSKTTEAPADQLYPKISRPTNEIPIGLTTEASKIISTVYGHETLFREYVTSGRTIYEVDSTREQNGMGTHSTMTLSEIIVGRSKVTKDDNVMSQFIEEISSSSEATPTTTKKKIKPTTEFSETKQKFNEPILIEKSQYEIEEISSEKFDSMSNTTINISATEELYRTGIKDSYTLQSVVTTPQYILRKPSNLTISTQLSIVEATTIKPIFQTKPTLSSLKRMLNLLHNSSKPWEQTRESDDIRYEDARKISQPPFVIGIIHIINCTTPPNTENITISAEETTNVSSTTVGVSLIKARTSATTPIAITSEGIRVNPITISTLNSANITTSTRTSETRWSPKTTFIKPNILLTTTESIDTSIDSGVLIRCPFVFIGLCLTLCIYFQSTF